MHPLLTGQQFAGHKAVVVGAGISGLCAARLLVMLGASVRLVDANPDCQIPADIAESGIEVRLGTQTAADFEGANLVVPSPGVPPAKIRPLLPQGAQLVAELELASWFVDSPIIAVTGTNGKTTTTGLISHVLEQRGFKIFTGGNIGTPLSAYLLAGERADIVVLEVSSFQLDLCTSFRPKVGVLLNFSDNHLDYHADMAEYLAAKCKLFARMTQDDLAVVHLGLKELFMRSCTCDARKVFYTASGVYRCPVLPGMHNAENVEAAGIALKAFGVEPAAFNEAAETFVPYPHRLAHVAEVDGVLFIDDSKATTLTAQAAAVAAFNRPVRLMCGGVFKGGNPAELLPGYLGKVAEVGLFGASREVFESAWQDDLPVSWAATMDEIFEQIVSRAVAGDVVLLSPATSSFDLYPNYKARGDHFIRLVHELEKRRGGPLQ